MVRGLSILVALVGLSAGTAFAQEVDARAALLASLKAMGGENLKTIEISGAGSSSLIGQQYSVEGNWPQFEVADYTRAIDFDAKWSREDYTRRQGNFPTFGRVPMAEQRVTAIVSGTYAWDMNDGMPVPFTRPYLDGVPFNEPPPARARDHAARRSSRRRSRPPMRRRSRCRTSAHRISGSRSSDAG